MKTVKEIIKGTLLGIGTFIVLMLVQILLFPLASQSALLVYYSSVIVAATVLFVLRLLAR